LVDSLVDWLGILLVVKMVEMWENRKELTLVVELAESLDKKSVAP
jgi:hypothetical protein